MLLCMIKQVSIARKSTAVLKDTSFRLRLVGRSTRINNFSKRRCANGSSGTPMAYGETFDQLSVTLDIGMNLC